MSPPLAADTLKIYRSLIRHLNRLPSAAGRSSFYRTLLRSQFRDCAQSSDKKYIESKFRLASSYITMVPLILSKYL